MTLNVIDVASPYQKGINIKATGADAVIVKVSEGYGYLNPDRKDMIDQTLNSGKELGLYHFLHAGNIQKQGALFIKEIKPYIGKAMLFADVESYTGGHASAVETKQFMDYTYNHTGVKPLLYTNVADLNAYNYGPIAKADYGLWLAQYNTMNQSRGFNPNIKIYGNVRFWKTVALHQYSSNTIVPGWGRGIDVSVFAGNKNTWQAYAKQVKKVAIKPASKYHVAVDGSFGPATTKALQQMYGTKPVDGIISHPYSNLVKVIQGRLGVTQDGSLGPTTIKAMQRKLGTRPVDGVISNPSNMVKAMQNKINGGVKPF